MCIVDRTRVDGEIRNKMNNRCVCFLLNVSREGNNVRWLNGELSFRRNNVNTEQNAEIMNYYRLPVVCGKWYVPLFTFDAWIETWPGLDAAFLQINNNS